MAYARWEQPAQDAAGNLLTGVYCEVRSEGFGNPLATLYADREGATPLSNPFFSASGVPGFHVLGGAYRVRYYLSGYDETFRYIAIGTAQELDTDGLLLQGDGARVVDNLAALKAIDTTLESAAYLTAPGRVGPFLFLAGDYSTEVTADTLEGMFVEADDTAAAMGAWVRQDADAINIDWFDAHPNSATSSVAALDAAYSLLKVITSASEGCIGRIVAPSGYYTFDDSIELDKPVAIDMPGYWRYTPTSGSALIIGSTIPTGGQNTGYDIRIGGMRAMNGNTAAPTSYNAAGCSGIEVRNMQFSTLWVGRIIAFTKAGFWGNQTNDVFALQHCQDNTIHLGDVAYCGEGIRVESVDAALGAFQVNWVQVQNSFGNWTNFRVGGVGDNNTNNNLFVFHAMDADTGGGAGFVRGLYNDFQFGYADGVIAFESGSAYNRAYAQVGAAQVVFTDAGTGNIIGNAVEGWTTPNTNSPPIRVQSTNAGATYASLIELYRKSASPAANDGGVGIDAYFDDDGGTKRLGGTIHTDMPTVEAGGNRNLRWLFDTMVGGTVASRMILWQGLTIGAPTGGDQGVGTLNLAAGLSINGSLVVSSAKAISATGSVAVAGTAAGPASVSLAEDTDNGTSKVTLQAPASLAADKTLTLPDATGTLVTGPTSTTDNTLPRFDGAAGALQASGASIDDSGNLVLVGTLTAVNQVLAQMSGSNGTMSMQRTDAHGSGAYVGLMQAYGKDSGGNVTAFARMDFYCDDNTDGSEDGSFRVSTQVAGTLAERAKFAAGLTVGAPTGDDKGGGTINVASRVFTNNNEVPYRLQGTATYDPPSLADGAGATTTVTVTGAALGDMALASFSLTTSGITITAWVSATDTVSVRFQNESGGVLDIGSGTLKAWVLK